LTISVSVSNALRQLVSARLQISAANIHNKK